MEIFLNLLEFRHFMGIPGNFMGIYGNLWEFLGIYGNSHLPFSQYWNFPNSTTVSRLHVEGRSIEEFEIMLSDNKKIGIGLLGFGCFLIVVGVMLFFDRGLLALGNLMFLSGFPFLIGFAKTIKFFNPFARKEKLTGILCFLGGICLILFGWTFVGMIVECKSRGLK